MKSLYDDLNERLARDPRLTKRGGPRVDLSLFLFNHREAIHDLWLAANRMLERGADTPEDLKAAVEKLRPIFGERTP